MFSCTDRQVQSLVSWHRFRIPFFRDSQSHLAAQARLNPPPESPYYHLSVCLSVLPSSVGISPSCWCLCVPQFIIIWWARICFCSLLVFFSLSPIHLHALGNRANSDTENMAKKKRGVGSDWVEKSYRTSCSVEIWLILTNGEIRFLQRA